MEWALGRPRFQREREQALAAAGGEVLEIGFGTGLNLRHYPPGVKRLTAIDVADLLPARTGRRIAAAPFPVERVHLTRRMAWWSRLFTVPRGQPRMAATSSSGRSW